MSKILLQERLNAIEILQLPDEKAALWLKDNRLTNAGGLNLDDEHKAIHEVASFSFARRNSKSLRLAVARYGSNVRILKKFFCNGSSIDRSAVLENLLVGPRDTHFFTSHLVLSETDAINILKNHKKNSREFNTLLINPNINLNWLGQVIRDWDEYEELDLEALRLCIYALSYNPRLSKDQSQRSLGYSPTFEVESLNFQLVQLLQKAPIDEGWAQVLCTMLRKLYLPYVRDVEMGLIDRWRDPDPTDEGEPVYSFWELRKEITIKLIERGTWQDQQKEQLLRHEDSAVRRGCYESLRPSELISGVQLPEKFPTFDRDYISEEPTELDKKIRAILLGYFELDGEAFIQALIDNQNFWHKKRDRDLLKDLVWNLADDRDGINIQSHAYIGTLQRFIQDRPHYFKDDESVDIPSDNTINGMLVNIEEKILSLKDEQEHSFQSVVSIVNQYQDQINQLAYKLAAQGDAIEESISQHDISKSLKNINNRISNQGYLLWTIAGLFVLLLIT